MSSQFQRSCRVTIGTIQIVGLATRFEIKKNLKNQPNEANIRILNLQTSTRKAIESAKSLPCKVEAGYGTDLHTLFSGNVRRKYSVVDGNDIITTIAAGESDVAYTTQRMQLQIAKGASAKQILIAAGQLMGATIGNLANLDVVGRAAGSATQIHGNAGANFTQLCRAYGYEWSIQNNALQVLPIGKTLPSVQIVQLTPASGLVGSPSVDNKGVMKARALIQPGLLPGRGVSVQAFGVKGTFRIEEVVFTGDTWGVEWYTDISGRRPAA